MFNQRKMLIAGIILPVFYYVNLVVAGALYPDFSHTMQVPSDLGADGAPYAWTQVFNLGLVIVGLLGGLAAIGVYRGLTNMGGRAFFALLTAITLLMTSANMIMSGVFPLPSPYHSNFYVVMAGAFTPLLAALSLNRVPSTRRFSAILLTFFAVNFALTAVLLGVGELLTENNVGLWIRLWATPLMVAIGYLCWELQRRISKPIFST